MRRKMAGSSCLQPSTALSTVLTCRWTLGGDEARVAERTSAPNKDAVRRSFQEKGQGTVTLRRDRPRRPHSGSRVVCLRDVQGRQMIRSWLSTHHDVMVDAYGRTRRSPG